MRWDSLLLDSSDARDPAGGSPLPLIERNAVARTFDTPEFRGMTFYEVHAKSIVSEVPKSSRMMFRYTINPYRGCQHSCDYCFARNTHTYLDLDAGRDFDTKVVVKVNAPELLRAKLASPGWAGEHIAMGTNVDCYQRAEGRYRLMRGIIAALRDAREPVLDPHQGDADPARPRPAALGGRGDRRRAERLGGFVDKSLWRAIEPGTPAPERRLEACAALNDAGLRCGVLMGPVVPYLSDSPAQLAAAVRQAAAAGAAHVTPIVLHLRPGAREWFLGWLREAHPELVPRYAELYGRGAYARKDYQARIAGQVRELADRFGVGRGNAARREPRRAAADGGTAGGPPRPPAAAPRAARTAVAEPARAGVPARAATNTIDQHRSELNNQALLASNHLPVIRG